MKKIVFFSFVFFAVSMPNWLSAQDDSSAVDNAEAKLKFSGELLSDERFLIESPNNWAWNENRLTLKAEKKISGTSKFCSEVWLRNMGLPQAATSSDLYNKGIIDPYSIEIREAYVQATGFLTRNLDLKIGRQRIVWGTADKLNPTDNLNPLDMEDILDFGRRRGSDAINLQYYLNSDYSLQAVFLPFFQPANLPTGVFSTFLTSSMTLPQGMVLMGYSDELELPEYNIEESATAGAKFRGASHGLDFSLSYLWGRDFLPMATYNTFTPVDAMGGVSINTKLSYLRTHIIGADLSTSIGGAGVWAEAAVFIPEDDLIMTTDLSALYPMSPVPVTQDSVVLKKEAYVKFIAGGDYNFSDGSYLNLQFMHGFFHEKGVKELNDYIFIQYEKKFLSDKLKIAPVSGAFIVTDWGDLSNNYAVAWMPQISYMATSDMEIILSALIAEGKGNGMFTGLKDYQMGMLKLKYSF